MTEIRLLKSKLFNSETAYQNRANVLTQTEETKKRAAESQTEETKKKAAETQTAEQENQNNEAIIQMVVPALIASFAIRGGRGGRAAGVESINESESSTLRRSKRNAQNSF